MIQNAVGDVTELETVKKLADIGVANGNRPLTYESYVALLLEDVHPLTRKVNYLVDRSALCMLLQSQTMTWNTR
jgi:hypothetical protein